MEVLDLENTIKVLNGAKVNITYPIETIYGHREVILNNKKEYETWLQEEKKNWDRIKAHLSKFEGKLYFSSNDDPGLELLVKGEPSNILFWAIPSWSRFINRIASKKIDRFEEIGIETLIYTSTHKIFRYKEVNLTRAMAEDIIKYQGLKETVNQYKGFENQYHQDIKKVKSNWEKLAYNLYKNQGFEIHISKDSSERDFLGIDLLVKIGEEYKPIQIKGSIISNKRQTIKYDILNIEVFQFNTVKDLWDLPYLKDIDPDLIYTLSLFGTHPLTWAEVVENFTLINKLCRLPANTPNFIYKMIDSLKKRYNINSYYSEKGLLNLCINNEIITFPVSAQKSVNKLNHSQLLREVQKLM